MFKNSYFPETLQHFGWDDKSKTKDVSSQGYLFHVKLKVAAAIN